MPAPTAEVVPDVAAFQIKKGRKIYRVKAFASVLKLAERGLIEADDLIFVPSLNRWVYAGSIKEMKQFVGDTTQLREPEPPTPEEQRTAVHESLDLPMAYVEALQDDEMPGRPVPGTRPRWLRPAPEPSPPQAARPELPERIEPAPRAPYEPQISPITFDPGPLAQLGTVDPSPSRAAQGGSQVEASGLSLGGLRDPYGGRVDLSNVSGVTVHEGSTKGVRLGRILALLSLPAAALLVFYLTVRTTAVQDFPDQEPGVPNQVEPVAVVEPIQEVYGAPTPTDSVRALEVELRKKVPLALRNPVRDQDQVQNDLFAEMLNGGAFPQGVAVAPVAGEIPEHASLRNLDVRVILQIKETSGMDTRDQIALVALIVGKYQRAGGLKVVELEVNLRASDGRPINTYSLTGTQVRDFYGREVSLSTFFEWLDL